MTLGQGQIGFYSTKEKEFGSQNGDDQHRKKYDGNEEKKHCTYMFARLLSTSHMFWNASLLFAPHRCQLNPRS